MAAERRTYVTPKNFDLLRFGQGYDADTYILTARGWKRFDWLQDDDRVFVWNDQDNTLELEKLAEVYTAEYEGTMHPYVNRHIDIFCMPGTKIIARKRATTSSDKDVELKKYPAEFIKKTWQLDIPVAAKFAGTKNVLPKAAFEFGLWCSGLLRDDAEIRIDKAASQAFHKAIGAEFEERTEAEYRRAFNLMKAKYADRELSWDLLLWDYEARKKFLAGFFEGRGRRYPPAQTCLLLVTKEGASEILQALTMSLGYRSQISPGNGVFFSPNRSTSAVFHKHRPKTPTEGWRGTVWNIMTDAGAMVVRRNKKISIVTTL